jgi:hypothetical protein
LKAPAERPIPGKFNPKIERAGMVGQFGKLSHSAAALRHVAAIVYM